FFNLFFQFFLFSNINFIVLHHLVQKFVHFIFIVPSKTSSKFFIMNINWGKYQMNTSCNYAFMIILFKKACATILYYVYEKETILLLCYCIFCKHFFFYYK